MANEQNLRPSEYKFTQEDAKKGQRRSAEVRRQRKTMRDIARVMATAKVAGDRNKAVLAQLGLEEDEMVNSALVVAGVLKSAQNGNINAVEKWEQMVDAQDAQDKPYELPARVLGKAFVDINRSIIPNVAYVFEGGRGGLKSSYISLKIIELIKNNPMLHACVTRKVANTLKDSVYAQMKWAINELGLADEFDYVQRPPEITYKKTGQKIYFRGIDDPMKLKGIKPEFGYVGILWKEEKDQLNGAEEERSVNQSVLRGGDITYDFSSYNPPKSKSAWVHKEKEIPNDKRVIHSCTYLDAPREWLGQKFIDDAEHLKEVNPEAYEHEYLGVANGDGGSVFEYIEVREITDEEIATFDNIFQGVDWGWYPDPFAFVRIYFDVARDTIYFLDEYGANKEANSKTGQWILDHKYDDFPITCDSAEKKSVNDFRDMGLPARPAIKGAGSIEYGMKYIQGRKIVIDPKRTPKTFKEFTEYEYERDKEGNVISGYPDANNHFIDATRYALEKFYNKRGTSA